jgi:hypothetical protein
MPSKQSDIPTDYQTQFFAKLHKQFKDCLFKKFFAAIEKAKD